MLRRIITTVLAMLLACCVAQGEDKPIKVLIITGDHGHAWKETTPVLKEVLSEAGMEVDVTENPRLDLVPEKLSKYQVLLFNYRDTPQGAAANPNSVWSDENKKAFLEAVRGGIGLVMYHHASSAFRGDSDFDREFETLSAGGWRNQGHHGAMHEFVVSVRQEHPITRDINSFSHGRDELYQNSLITPGSEVLVTAYSDPSKDPKNTGKDEPMVWINEYGEGRVVQNALGHDTVAMESPGFQILLVRCVEWAATGETKSETPGLEAKKE
jgi:type 1 glutamine amidotransferase